MAVYLTSYIDCPWVSVNHFCYLVDVTLASKMAGAITGDGMRELVIETKELKTNVNSAVDQNDTVSFTLWSVSRRICLWGCKHGEWTSTVCFLAVLS